MYQRKTKDVWWLMSNYNSGCGWECEVEYDDYQEAKADLKAYRENCAGKGWSFKLEKHRERIMEGT